MIKKTLHKINKFVADKVNSSISGTHDHYLSVLPESPGFILKWIFSLFLSKVDISGVNTKEIRKLGEEGIIIYTSKHKKYLDFLFAYNRYKKENIPHPTIGFSFSFILLQPVMHLFRYLISRADFLMKYRKLPEPFKSGFMEKELVGGKSAMLSLIDKKTFRDWFIKSESDPLENIIRLQKTTDKPVFIVPQVFFFGKTPSKSTRTIFESFRRDRENPSFVTRISSILNRHPEVFVETSDVLNLRDFLKRPDVSDLTTSQIAILLRHTLIDRINKHRQSITGPVIKSREEIMENILTGEGFWNFMTDYASETNQSIQEVHKQAAKFLDEIASNYNIRIVKGWMFILNWVFKNLFEDVVVDREDLYLLKGYSRKAPLVLLPSHKSHIDYLLLSYILFKNNMPSPHVVSGRNLSFWPVGPLFRGAGAFFIRRSFRKDKLYSKVLAEYTATLLQEGFNIEFFIEGGRSRTGKLLSPKYGMLSYVIEAYKDKEIEDLCFVPVYIGYDKIMEEKEYLHELGGGEKIPESAGAMLKIRKVLRKKYGKIYLKFSEPISLAEYYEEKGINRKLISKVEKRKILSDLGTEVICSINESTVVSPMCISASALLSKPGKKLSLSVVYDSYTTLSDYLTCINANRTDYIDGSEEINFKMSVESFLQQGMIESEEEVNINEFHENLYKLPSSKRTQLDYYRNISIMYFIPAAFAAHAIIYMDSFEFSPVDINEKYNLLRNLFKNEFARRNDIQVEVEIETALSAFKKTGIIHASSENYGKYIIDSAGFRKLMLFAEFARPFLESYYTVLKFIIDKKQNKQDTKLPVKKVLSLGKSMYRKREIRTPESLSKINYINAFNYYEESGITESIPSGSADNLLSEIEHFLNQIS